MPFVVKAALAPEAMAKASLSFREKTMYRGKEVAVGDEIFIFASDHMGGQGLCARGVVTKAAYGPGIRVTIEVRPIAKARRALGRRELATFRERTDRRPETEIACKLYRQATNKIAGVSDAAGVFLMTFFQGVRR